MFHRYSEWTTTRMAYYFSIVNLYVFIISSSWTQEAISRSLFVSADATDPGNQCNDSNNDQESNIVCQESSQSSLEERMAVFGEIQESVGMEKEITDKVIAEMLDYMENEVFVDVKYEKVRQECKNRHSQCAFWAGIGECEKNKSYMKVQCSAACKSCLLVDVNNRCPKPDPNEFPDAFKSGDLNLMFERIISGSWQELDDDLMRPSMQIEVLSAPKGYTKVIPTNQGTLATVNDSKVQIGGPWIISIDNFLTQEETDHLIEWGHKVGYERSGTVGSIGFDGLFSSDHENASRTSENAWCEKECKTDPLTIKIQERIAKFTGE